MPDWGECGCKSCLCWCKEGKRGDRLLSHGSATPSYDQVCVYSFKEHKRGTCPHILFCWKSD